MALDAVGNSCVEPFKVPCEQSENFERFHVNVVAGQIDNSARLPRERSLEGFCPRLLTWREEDSSTRKKESGSFFRHM